jgi:hypothetical protein
MTVINVSEKYSFSLPAFFPDNYNANLEDRVYQLVLGKIFPAICLGLSISCAVLTFTVSPLFIIGVVTFFPIAAVVYEVMNIERVTFFDEVAHEPFQNGQPLGLINRSNDCWVNAAIQVIMHCEPLCMLLSQDPRFAQIAEIYRNSLDSKQSLCPMQIGQQLRDHLLHQGLVQSKSSMEDPSTLFENLLGSLASPYEYEQQVGGMPTDLHQVEPFISLELENGRNFAEMLHDHFEYLDDEERVITKRLVAAPDSLIVKLSRFSMTGTCFENNLRYHKKKLDVAIPFELTLTVDKVADGRERAYECSGFFVHIGSSIQGGHYISYVKKNDSWWCCNDSRVFRVSESEALRAGSQAYFVCYTSL